MGGIDPFFHTQRIYEIKSAFQNCDIPVWVNFKTFNFAGQAINGMYPDYTLWLFVLLTIWINKITAQVIVIKSLILLSAFYVTDYTLKVRGFDKISSVLCAWIYVTSGYYSYIFYQQFQPNTMMVMVVLFPLLFSLSDIFQVKEFSIKLTLIFSLLLTWVLFSHLVSFVVLVTLVMVIIVYKLVVARDLSFNSLKILMASAALTVIMGSSLLYRVLIISMSKLHTPFNAGKVGSEEFVKLFTNSTWDATNGPSIAAILALILVLVSGKLKTDKTVQKLAMVEFMILIFCSSILPWNVLEKLPVIGNFQFSQWRYGLFTSFIPMVMLMKSISRHDLRKILLVFSILSIGIMIGKEYSYRQEFTQNPVLNAQTKGASPMSTTMLVKEGGITNPSNISVIPDYVPKNVATKSVTFRDDTLNDDVKNELTNHFLVIGKNKVPTKVSPEKKGLSLEIVSYNKKSVKNIQLPIFGYSTLQYTVTLNGKSVPYHVNSKGFLEIRAHIHSGEHVLVHLVLPKMYKILLYANEMTVIVAIVCLTVMKKKQNEVSVVSNDWFTLKYKGL